MLIVIFFWSHRHEKMEHDRDLVDKPVEEPEVVVSPNLFTREVALEEPTSVPVDSGEFHM